MRVGQPTPDNQQGSVLVLVLLVSLLLLGLGLSVMWMSNTGTGVTTNIRRRQEAIRAAEAGIARARAVLAATSNWTTVLGTKSGGSCSATKDDTNGRGNVLCDGPTPLENVKVVETEAVSAGHAGLASVRYTVYIRNDDAETAAGSKYSDNDKRVIVRSEGIGRSGQGEVALEVTLVAGAATSGASGSYSQAGENAAGSNSGKTAIGD